jgi:hypothetical protein
MGYRFRKSEERRSQSTPPQTDAGGRIALPFPGGNPAVLKMFFDQPGY